MPHPLSCPETKVVFDGIFEWQEGYKIFYFRGVFLKTHPNDRGQALFNPNLFANR